MSHGCGVLDVSGTSVCVLLFATAETVEAPSPSALAITVILWPSRLSRRMARTSCGLSQALRAMRNSRPHLPSFVNPAPMLIKISHHHARGKLPRYSVPTGQIQSVCERVESASILYL